MRIIDFFDDCDNDSLVKYWEESGLLMGFMGRHKIVLALMYEELAVLTIYELPINTRNKRIILSERMGPDKEMPNAYWHYLVFPIMYRIYLWTLEQFDVIHMSKWLSKIITDEVVNMAPIGHETEMDATMCITAAKAYTAMLTKNHYLPQTFNEAYTLYYNA